MEFTLLEPTIMQPETVGVPVQDLELVAAPVAEDEPMCADRIKLQRLGHHQRQAIDRFPEVNMLGRQVGLASRGD